MKFANYAAAVFAIACAFFAFDAVAKADDNDSSFRVMSFNIRCDSGVDGDNNWEFRRETLIDVVKENDPMLLGVQEAVPGQMDYLSEKLTDYKWVGVGRDDGKRKGEFMSIFYKPEMVDLLDSGTFWLSQTPDEPSKGWDAQCFRTVTWCKFKCKKTGKEFVYANTHMDHVGTIARKKGAKLIIKRMYDITKGELPFFVSGDFNVNDQHDAYISITEGVDDIPGLRDANKIAKERDAAQEYTYHNWGKIPPEKGDIIDFIFVNDKVDVLKFKINPLKHSNGRYASDHVSIVATLSF
ncbi:MAG: endonuclease/exonuclease/phosphatase family protein [Thermoguttaceae bacterium]|nr:endonuclease/exonuclease/phosphatase family protein [Thermoguttaceae bacterium]